MKGLILKIVGVLTLLSSPVLIGSVAHAADFTWTGGGTPDGSGNLLFSDSANWDSAPATDGSAVLIFPKAAAADNIVNDLTAGTSFAGMQFTMDGTAAQGSPSCPTSGTTIAGNAIGLSGNITGSVSPAGTTCPYYSVNLELDITLSAPVTVTGVAGVNITIGAFEGDDVLNLGSNGITLTTNISIYAGLAGSGTLTVNGVQAFGDVSLYADNSAYTGAINVTTGSIQINGPLSFGSASGGTTVADGATLYLCSIDTTTVYNEPITMGGLGSYDEGTLFLQSSCGRGGGGGYTPQTATLAGSLTLTANATVITWDNLTITGPMSGNFTLTSRNESLGTLTINSSANTSGTPNGVQAVTYTTTTIDNNEPSSVLNVGQTDIVILKGVRGDTDVTGVLKGTGTVGALMVWSQGKLAPGLSPGCINSGNLTLSGTYEVELADLTACTEYDQTNVTGTVNLTGSTLSVIRFDSMVPRLNDSFTIILNDGTDPVTGTFTGIAQGGTIVAGGITYSVSYTGGTGNDVVLVVTAVDASLGAPNTGVMQIVKSGTILPILAILAAFGIVGLNFAHKKR